MQYSILMEYGGVYMFTTFSSYVLKHLFWNAINAFVTFIFIALSSKSLLLLISRMWVAISDLESDDIVEVDSNYLTI